MIEGFTRINKSNETEFNQLANKAINVNRDDVSPYKEGKRFKLSSEGYCFARSLTTNSVGVVALLIDEQGAEQELWLSTLFKKGFEKHGTEIVEIENASTIAKQLKEKLTPQTTNKELGELFVQLVGNKEIICHRQKYVRTIPTRRGTSFEVVASLVGFEFA